MRLADQGEWNVARIPDDCDSLAGSLKVSVEVDGNDGFGNEVGSFTKLHSASRSGSDAIVKSTLDILRVIRAGW
jgi:hypothetical protein